MYQCILIRMNGSTPVIHFADLSKYVMNADQASESPPAAETKKSLPAPAIEATNKPGGSVTAYLDDNFAGDISNDEHDECEGTDGDENDDPILQEACTLASSDVIELEEDNGINLSAPALTNLLHNKLTHDIFDHLSSGRSSPSSVVGH